MAEKLSWGIRIERAEHASGEEHAAAIAEGTRNGMEKIGLRGEALVVDNISSPFNGRPDAVSSGTLAGSIESELQIDGDTLTQMIFVGTPADVYGDPVEMGTRPHFPPPSALLLWVKREIGVQDEKQALSIAFAIAKTIEKRGTPAHRMFGRALGQLESEAPGIIEREIAEALEAQGLTA